MERKKYLKNLIKICCILTTSVSNCNICEITNGAKFLNWSITCIQRYITYVGSLIEATFLPYIYFLFNLDRDFLLLQHSIACSSNAIVATYVLIITLSWCNSALQTWIVSGNKTHHNINALSNEGALCIWALDCFLNGMLIKYLQAQ